MWISSFLLLTLYFVIVGLPYIPPNFLFNRFSSTKFYFFFFLFASLFPHQLVFLPYQFKCVILYFISLNFSFFFTPNSHIISFNLFSNWLNPSCHPVNPLSFSLSQQTTFYILLVGIIHVPSTCSLIKFLIFVLFRMQIPILEMR